MPRSTPGRKPYHIKLKYHAKTLSSSALFSAFQINLNIQPLFADLAWMQIPAFDLTELGLSILYNILPIDFEPYAIDFQYEPPTPQEALQGIWAIFTPVPFEKLYMWMTDFREYIIENIKEEYQLQLIETAPEKARYGITLYGRGVYDPILAREFLRATFYRLRLLRTPDPSWLKDVKEITELLDMIPATDDVVWNRLMLIMSSQVNAFVLGLSPLGKAKLAETEKDYAKIPIITADRRELTVKFSTLDQLQLGFILGITPLGYGILLPKTSIYRLPEGKKNPPIIDVLLKKVRGIINRTTLTTWAYGNYNKPEEMVDPHKSDRTAQYALMQTTRRHIEAWVAEQIPSEESNPVRIRQYQNAILQAVSWKAMRHKWGFQAWRYMPEEQFKEWWIEHWLAKGLNKGVLQGLYRGIEPWVKRLREQKLGLGAKVKQSRLRLALST